MHRWLAVPFIFAVLSLSIACDTIPLGQDPYAAGEKAYEKQKAFNEGMAAAMEKDLAGQRETYFEEYGHRLEDYCTLNYLDKIDPDSPYMDGINPYNPYRKTYQPPSHMREGAWANDYCEERWSPDAKTANTFSGFFIQSEWDVLHETACPMARDPENQVMFANGTRLDLFSDEAWRTLQELGLDYSANSLAWDYCTGQLKDAEQALSNLPTPIPLVNKEGTDFTPVPFITTIGTPSPAGESGDSLPAPREKRNRICHDTTTGREEYC